MKCLECNKRLESKHALKYCSRKCAFTTSKNKSRNMSHRKIVTYCSSCKKEISNYNKYCKSCRYSIQAKTRRTESLNRDIQYHYDKNNGTANAYSAIRTLARRIMNETSQPRQCYYCSYDKHVEVCHVKPISSFDKATKIEIVNSLDNLMYLCPNCHWEKDNLND